MVPLSIPLTLSWHQQSSFDRCCGKEPVRLTGLRLPCSRCNCPLVSWPWATLEASPWLPVRRAASTFPGWISTSLSASESGRNDPAAVRCLWLQVLSAAGLGLRERGRWLSEFPAAYCRKNMCFPGMLSTVERVNLQDCNRRPGPGAAVALAAAPRGPCLPLSKVSSVWRLSG